MTASQQLFRDKDQWHESFREALEIRLKHLRGGGRRLGDHIRLTVENLGSPSVAYRQVRGIADEAFKVIWDAECPDRNLPSHWMEKFKQEGESRIDRIGPCVPRERGDQIRLLRLANKHNLLKYISDSSYRFTEALHNAGNAGQHETSEKTVTEGAVQAVALMAFELADQLADEIQTKQ